MWFYKQVFWKAECFWKKETYIDKLSIDFIFQKQQML